MCKLLSYLHKYSFCEFFLLTRSWDEDIEEEYTIAGEVLIVSFQFQFLLMDFIREFNCNQI